MALNKLNNLGFNYFPHTKTLFTFKPNTLKSYTFSPSNSTLNCSQSPNNANKLLSYIPGGTWWKLNNFNQEENNNNNPVTVTVSVVLSRIWELVVADNNNNNDDDNINSRRVIFTAFASLVIASLCEISIPNLLTASIFSAQRGDTTVFYRNSRLLLSLCIVSGICSGMRSGCFGVANLILLKRLRETLYKALTFQDISFFDKETVGNLTSRLGADCQRLSNIIGSDIHLIIRNVLQGTGAIISLLTLSWPLALSSLSICLLLSTVFFFYGRYQKKAAKFTQEYSAIANEVAHETFSLIRTVRSYGTEEEELQRYRQRLENLASISSRESAAYGLWNFSFNTLYRSTQVIAILLGGMSVISGRVSAEQLLKYVLYCEWLIYAAWRVENSLSSLLQSVGASEKVFQLISLMPSDEFISEGKKLQGLEGKIEFVNVSFRYSSRLSVPVLENLNITVQANEMVAIVGLNGSGKSTILNLLLRLYEPTNGQICVDGFPLESLNIKWLREKIGFVGQEPRLFHEDVRSNISFGCPRKITLEDIKEAAIQAHAHEFISSLPYGYDTVINDNLLSGGQKQRIAIARAIVRDPTILILDEPTSALDAENEYNITRVLDTFRNDTRRKRTVIVIAHRLSTVKVADKIIVMDGGRVVEAGTHSELIQNDRLYARLIRIKP